jgi:uroporphyrinogen III methyltransferase/synthase
LLLVAGQISVIYLISSDQHKNTEKLPLAGKKIVITRPEAQSANFSDRLTELGAEVINFPTIEISAVGNFAFDKALENLETYDWLVFTSCNAVEIFFRIFSEKKQGTKGLLPLKIAVIGSKTAACLEKYNLKADLIPPEFIAESLISEFAGREIRGKRFLIPGAAMAREILPEQLVKLGAIVDNLAIYNTVIPDLAGYDKLINRLTLETIDYITFTSASSLNNFAELLKNLPAAKILAASRVVCIGPQTAAAVSEKFGVKPLIAVNYTIDGIIESILNDTKKAVL